LQLTDIAASILQSIYIVASILQLIDIAMSKPTSQATQQQPRQAQSDSEKDSNNMMVIRIKFPGGWQFQSAQRRIQTM
jgi:hypothetical protein